MEDIGRSFVTLAGSSSVSGSSSREKSVEVKRKLVGSIASHRPGSRLCDIQIQITECYSRNKSWAAIMYSWNAREAEKSRTIVVDHREEKTGKLQPVTAYKFQT